MTFWISQNKVATIYR